MVDAALGGTPEGYVQKRPDVAGTLVPIPDDQMAYLKTRLP